MAGWLKRILGVAAKPASVSRPTAATAATVATAQTAETVPPSAFVNRRPLVSRQGAINGFDFHLSDEVEQRLRERTDPVARAAHVIALLASMRSTIEGGRVAMATLPDEVLTRPAVLDSVSGAYIVIDPLAGDGFGPRPDRAELRRRGVRIGAVADAGAAMRPCDFIVVRRGTTSFEALAADVSRQRVSAPDAPVVLVGIESVDELERALALDVWLVGTRFQVAPVKQKPAPLQPTVMHICQVLSRLRDERHTAEVCRQLGADVALSYRLLRFVNSPAFGLARSAASIEEAVMLVGHAGLYRWLSIALLASADARMVSRALQEVSLARARFMELLAGACGRDPPQALFTVGLLSLLDALLQVPMADALAPLHLGEHAEQALLTGQGPWWKYLALAQDLESNHLVSAAERAAEFGGLDGVLRYSDLAWQWAGEFTQALRS
jgi:c-di-GMP phosphodiesterase